MIALRPYQEQALAAIVAAQKRGIQRPLVSLPTGTGKTVLFGEWIRRQHGRALVLAHRDELIQQAVDKLRMIDPTMNIGVVKAGRDEVSAQVVVASVQTLARPARLARLGRDFATVVVDEAHHGVAESYVQILEHVGSFSPGGTFTLGVTATPERADGSALTDVWEEIVYQASLVTMIRARYLADLTAIRVQIEADLNGVHTRAGDLVAGELGSVMLDAEAPQHVARAYKKFASERKGLIFTPTVAVAHAMAEALRDEGFAAEALDGETPTDERRDILARLHSGETQVVANCGVLCEGFDGPSIDCIVIARPTKSRPLYTQMVGRGTRTYPGKTDCLIIDVVGVTSRHDLATATELCGLPEGSLAMRKSVVEAVQEQEAAATAAKAATALQGRLHAQKVELFGKAQLSWIDGRDGQHVLSVGEHGFVVLRPRGPERWRVEHVQEQPRKRDVVADNLDLGYAMGVAEDYVRKLGASTITSKGARWRVAPATPKQIAALQRWRVSIPAGLTKGQASDLLTRAVAQRSV